jgi:short-subunit dehydrogenase
MTAAWKQQDTGGPCRAGDGASRGIGAATAEALAAAGAHVILTARTAADLEQVEDRIHDAGGTATIAPLDLTEQDGIGKLGAAIAVAGRRSTSWC